MTGQGEEASPTGVAVLIDSLTGGGAERVAVDAAAHLDRGRFRPTLVVTRYGGALEELARGNGIPFTVLGRRRGFSPRLLLRAVRIVRGCGLLHAHKFAGGTWGVLIGRLARRPVIVHEHTFDGRRTLLRTLLYRHWIGRGAHAVICVSEGVRDAVIAEGVPPGRVVVIPNAVEADGALDRAAARTALGLAPEGHVVGIVGRLRPEKRHDLLLDAVAAAQRDGARFTLCAVGDGPLRADLEAQARALGIDGSVVWAGEQRDAGRLLAAFDVAVLCSDFEGMPLAALEALAAGTPLVATDVGSLPTLLASGAGVVVPPSDAGALARAIVGLLDDDEARASAGRAGRAAVAERYSWPVTTAALTAVYEDALARG